MPGSRPAPIRPDPDPRGMTGADQTPRFFGLVLVAALVIVGAGLKATASVVAPIFLVITLVITVAPLRRWLVARKVPAALATVATLIAIYALLLVILGSVVWSIVRLVEKLPEYSTAFGKLFNTLLAAADRFGYGRDQLNELVSTFDFTSLAGPARGLLGGITNGASLLLLMLTVVIFLTFDSAGMKSRIELIRTTRPNVADGLDDFSARVRKYWVVTTIFGLIVAVLDVVGLLIIGVPLALTWGVLAFVTNYIPNIGFILGVIPPALIALLDGGVGTMIAVIALYAVLNFVIQTVIQPRSTGDAVGITGTVAFVSLIFWSFVLGPLGALLAVPATLFVKALLVDHSTGGQWVGALIDSAPDRRPPARPDRRKRGGRR